MLLPLFLEMGAARLQIRGETAAHDILRAFGVLEEAPELRELLARVERDAARFAASQPRRAEGPYAELLPWLAEQGYDWELAATVNITGDTPLLRVRGRWGGGAGRGGVECDPWLRGSHGPPGVLGVDS